MDCWHGSDGWRGWWRSRQAFGYETDLLVTPLMLVDPPMRVLVRQTYLAVLSPPFKVAVADMPVSQLNQQPDRPEP